MLFAIEYEKKNGRERAYKKADDGDLAIFERARALFEAERDSLPFPRDEIPTEGRYDNRPVSYGFKHYWQLFNERQLYCLSLILREILSLKDRMIKEFLLLAFSDCLASNNMLCSYAFGYRKLTPLFGLHAYRMVNRPVEGNVLGAGLGRGSFIKCVRKLVDGKKYCKNPYEAFYGKSGFVPIHTGESIEVTITEETGAWYSGEARCLLLNQSSERIRGLRDGTIDLILTDPPYYDNLPYSELSDFYYVWLKQAFSEEADRWKARSTPYRDSLLVSEATLDQHRRYTAGLTNVFKECRRVSRPNGMMVFTFHHRRPGAWLALYSALHDADWRVSNVMPILSEGKSGFHSSKGSLKWDVVFVCRPRVGHCSRRMHPANLEKWVETRAEAWKDRLGRKKLIISSDDLRSLRIGLVIARLTQIDAPFIQGSPYLESAMAGPLGMGRMFLKDGAVESSSDSLARKTGADAPKAIKSSGKGRM